MIKSICIISIIVVVICSTLIFTTTIRTGQFNDMNVTFGISLLCLILAISNLITLGKIKDK